MADPEPFSGNRRQARQFMMQCQIKFSGEPEKFQSEQQKVLYAASRLRSVAFDWIMPFLARAEETPTDPPLCLTSFSAFRESFLLMFDDPERKTTAERQLFSLRQGNRSVAATAAEFQRLSLEAGFPEAGAFRLFYNCLNNDIKDELFRLDRPENFLAYVHQAIAVEGRLRERRSERHFGSDQRPARNRPSAPTSSDGAAPMQIDALQPAQSKPTKLTPEERARRFRENLCLYCGNAGHVVTDCTNKKSGNGRPRQ
jgi:hypothetical protein